MQTVPPPTMQTVAALTLNKTQLDAIASYKNWHGDFWLDMRSGKIIATEAQAWAAFHAENQAKLSAGLIQDYRILVLPARRLCPYLAPHQERNDTQQTVSDKES